MCDGEGKEYTPIDSLDKESKSDLNNLEKTLNNKSYINGTLISIEDIEALENLDLLNINITKTNFPNIFKWKKEIERMKLNWKISKKPPNVKGKTFKEYIKIQTGILNKKKKEFNEQMKSDMKFHENILKYEEKEKEVATIHFFTKKNGDSQEYVLKILIKFFPDINLTYKDLAPKIIIISHNHLVNKTDVEEYIDDKDNKKPKGVGIIITSLINSEDYNIENLSQELKRNINGISSVSILSIEKNEKK